MKENKLNAIHNEEQHQAAEEQRAARLEQDLFEENRSLPARSMAVV